MYGVQINMNITLLHDFSLHCENTACRFDLKKRVVSQISAILIHDFVDVLIFYKTCLECQKKKKRKTGVGVE